MAKKIQCVCAQAATYEAKELIRVVRSPRVLFPLTLRAKVLAGIYLQGN